MLKLYNTPTSNLVAWSRTPNSHSGDTVETTLATINVASNVMGTNGRLEILMLISFTGTSGTKTTRIRQNNTSGTVLFQGSAAASGLCSFFTADIWNMGSAGSQEAAAVALTGPSGTSAGATITAAIDTTVPTIFVITGQLANSGDTFSLDAYDATVESP